jgi:hypothetical protein
LTRTHGADPANGQFPESLETRDPAGVAGGHIRAIREGHRTYEVYFAIDGAGLEHAFYNLKTDPPRWVRSLPYSGKRNYGISMA